MITRLNPYSSIISHWSVIEKVTDPDLNYLKLRIFFSDSTMLSVFDKFYPPTGKRKYGYDWRDVNNNLIIRWDNSPHHPSISTFPHHKHVSIETNILESPEMTLEDVLDFIKQEIKTDAL